VDEEDEGEGDEEEDSRIINHVGKGRKKGNVEVFGTMLYPAIQCGSEDAKDTSGRLSHLVRRSIRIVLRWRTPGDGRVKDQSEQKCTRGPV
jgi:hypothetical protein